MRSTPGAARSIAAPVFENSAIVFVESTALTDTTPANEAGYILIRVASLPAAATIRTPASRAAVNVGWPSATWSGVSAPPRLMLMTSAPCSRAQSTPSRMSPNETKPESSAILIGIRVESGAMPATPTPLLVSARIVPVTCVPWPTWSLTSLLFQIMLRGSTTATPSRSGWVRSTPESITATTTEGSPRVVFQASGTSIWARSPCSA